VLCPMEQISQEFCSSIPPGALSPAASSPGEEQTVVSDHAKGVNFVGALAVEYGTNHLAKTR
jgi:hypothetical protein